MDQVRLGVDLVHRFADEARSKGEDSALVDETMDLLFYFAREVERCGRFSCGMPFHGFAVRFVRLFQGAVLAHSGEASINIFCDSIG